MTTVREARTTSSVTAFSAAYRLGLSAVATRGRLIGSAAGLALVLVQFAIISGADFDGEGIGLSGLLVALVLGVFVPIFTVLTAASVLGSLVTDGTLVYPWLRPAGRWSFALGHIAAALTLIVPFSLIATGGATALLLSGAGVPGSDTGEVVVASLAAALFATLGYAPLVAALGVRFKRASTFAFVYIFLVEGLFANNSSGISRLSVQTYVRSVYFGVAGETPTQGADRIVGLGPAILVISLIAALGVGLTVVFLKRADVA